MVDRFKEAVTTQNRQALITACQTPDPSVDLLVLYDNLSQDLRKILFHIHPPEKNRNQGLMETAKGQKIPIKLQLNFQSPKKVYKQLNALKKKNWTKLIWTELIFAVKQKNSARFWRMISENMQTVSQCIVEGIHSQSSIVVDFPGIMAMLLVL